MMVWNGLFWFANYVLCISHPSCLSRPSPSELQSVTLHTDLGDLKLELFCEQVPKACENVLAHCASGYYVG